MPFVVVSTFLEVLFEGSVVDFDSRFDHGVKSFGSVPSCNFVLDMLLEAFVELGRKCFVVPVGLFRILLEICSISDSRFILFEILNNSFSGSAGVDIFENFDNFLFKVCKEFKDLLNNWLLGLDIDNILQVIVKMKFDSVKYCSGQ